MAGATSGSAGAHHAGVDATRADDESRRPAALMPAEAGVLPDSTVRHAVRRTLTGSMALCGAGRVSVTAARFDPESADACTDCTASALRTTG